MPLVNGLEAAAREHEVPLFSTHEDTTQLVLKIINFLNNYLAPRITQHGVLGTCSKRPAHNRRERRGQERGRAGAGQARAQARADDVVDIRRVSADR